MPDEIRIELELGELTAAETSLGGIADRLERVAAILERIKGAAQGIGQAVPDPGGLQAFMHAQPGNQSAAAGAAAGGTGTAARTQRAPTTQERFVKGPYQRLQELAEQREQAELLPAGERRETILKDIAWKSRLAQRSVNLDTDRAARGPAALQGPGLLELFGEMNSLLRGIPGLGGIASHLGMGIHLVKEAAGGLNVTQRMAQAASTASAAGLTGAEAGIGAASSGGALAGIVAAAGPAALALGAMAAQIGIIAHVTEAAAGNLREFGRAMGMSGGTAGEVAGLTGRGMAAGDIATRGAALRQRAMSDPFVWALLGYQPDPRLPGSNQNNARLLVEAQRQLRAEAPYSNEQLRKARIFGMEDELDKINVSGGIRKFQDAIAGLNRAVNDPKSLQAARDYAEGQRLLGDEFKNLETQLGKPWVKTAANLFNDIGNAVGNADTAGKRFNEHLEKLFGREPVAAAGRARDYVQDRGTALAGGSLLFGISGLLAATVRNVYEDLRGTPGLGKAMGGAGATLGQFGSGAFQQFTGQTPGQAGDMTRGFFQALPGGKEATGIVDALADLVRDLAGVKKGKPGDVDQKQLDELKKILSALQDGFSGNVGPRTTGSIPAHMKGWYFDQSGAGSVMKYGSVSL